jgi:hypothetical protein
MAMFARLKFGSIRTVATTAMLWRLKRRLAVIRARLTLIEQRIVFTPDAAGLGQFEEDCAEYERLIGQYEKTKFEVHRISTALKQDLPGHFPLGAARSNS